MSKDASRGRLVRAGPGRVRTRFDAAAAVDARGIVAAPASLLVEHDRPPDAAAGPASFVESGPTCAAGVVVLLASGTPAEIDALLAAEPTDPARGGRGSERAPQRVDLAGAVLLPGLVNAHVHLDLTHVGPQPAWGLGGEGTAEGDVSRGRRRRGFSAWVRRLIAARAGSAEAVGASVAAGAQRLLEAGTVACGDIAGAVGGVPWSWATRALAGTGLGRAGWSVSYVEFFAGSSEPSRLASACARAGDEVEALAAELTPRPRVGLSPHATYSVAPGAMAWAARWCAARGLPLATHVAESLEEREAITTGGGPMADFLRAMSAWDERSAAWWRDVGTPAACAVEALERGLVGVPTFIDPQGRRRAAPVALVHAADLSPADVELIAGLGGGGTCVVYCPRAGAYFGAPDDLGPHRYRDLLRAGVPVALGTDSVVVAGDDRQALLDELRLLRIRDRADALTLLRMATRDGALALGLDPEAFVLRGDPDHPRAIAGLAAIGLPPSASAGPKAWEAALDGGEPCRLLLLGSMPSRETGSTRLSGWV